MLGTIDTNVLIYVVLYILALIHMTLLICGSATAAFLLIKGWMDKEAFRSELEKALRTCLEMTVKVEELWLETVRLRLDKAETVAVLQQRLRRARKEEHRLRRRLKQRHELLGVAAAEHARLMRERNEYRIRLALLQAERNWKRTALEYEFGLHSLSTPDPDSCEEIWEQLEVAAASGAAIESEVVGIGNDGLFMDVGVPAFLPAALIDISCQTGHEDFLWQILECRVMEVDRELRRVLLSRCSVLFEEGQGHLQQALNCFRREERVDGRVTDVDRGGIWVEVSPGVVGVVPLAFDSKPDADTHNPALEVGDEVRVETVAVNGPPFLLALALA